MRTPDDDRAAPFVKMDARTADAVLDAMVDVSAAVAGLVPCAFCRTRQAVAFTLRRTVGGVRVVPVCPVCYPTAPRFVRVPDPLPVGTVSDAGE